MPGSSLFYAGYPQAANYGLPDSEQRARTGLRITVDDSFWGARELIYVKSTGVIRTGALVELSSVLGASGFVHTATEMPFVTNTGKPFYVALVPMTADQFGWVLNSGLTPVLSNASVASGAALGIAANGQAGVNVAGRQLLNSVNRHPATTTIVKANCFANSGSNSLRVSSADGWFIGAFLSGSGIAAGTTVAEISPDGTLVTLSANTTAAVSGAVTATFNNGAIFYNVGYFDHSLLQGAIT